jgi:hypothetical protein
VADDTYGDPADLDSPLRQALAHDLMRGLAGGQPWLLMERAASAVNRRGHNLPKTPGRMRRDSLRAIARGADGSCSCVSGDSRRSAPNGSTRRSSRMPGRTPGCTVWCERLRLDDGEAVATFTGDLDGSPGSCGGARERRRAVVRGSRVTQDHLLR